MVFEDLKIKKEKKAYWLCEPDAFNVHKTKENN